MALEELIDQLENCLGEELPGRESQFKMAPEVREKLSHFDVYSKDPKSAAVLMLLYPIEEKLHTVFIRRPEYRGVHSNQISFPGGRKENRDKNFLETALREAVEEIGIERQKIRIIGSLSPLYIPPSNFLVRPCVGFYPERPEFVLQEREVVGILEVSLDLLSNRKIIKYKSMNLADGYSAKTPYYDIGFTFIWGATAMMISEFLDVYERCLG